MAFPERSRLEVPILQELKATGGVERVRVLYQRLVPYFPQLTPQDLSQQTPGRRNRWRLLVQRAGDLLAQKGEIQRRGGVWHLTEKGRQRAESEGMDMALLASLAETKALPSHGTLKQWLVEIGRWLGKYALEEYREQNGPTYDVVWKDNPFSPRISHVFEVQVRGKIDSALARLKHAYDTQRSRPFLIVSDERDGQKARSWLQPHLSGSFHEIGGVTTVLSAGDVERLHRSLQSVRAILEEIFKE